jgi:recombination protein RecT
MSNVSSAVAIRKQGAMDMIEGYRGDLAAVMPSHSRPEVFMRLAVSALQRDENLLKAAQNNPAALMTALWEAGRLGLEPGTKQYYLTIRKNKGVPEILGITGYQGEVELIYRAGAVSSVIVEVARKNDVFVWKQGSLDTHVPARWSGPQVQPYHEVDWDADPQQRGDLRLAYAYAVMKDGAISKVVVLNKAHIAKAKEYSAGSDGYSSPWVKNEESMWLKTAAHRLAKWVPTSAEYAREQLRAIADVAAERGGIPGAATVADSTGPAGVAEEIGAEGYRQLADEARDMAQLSDALSRAQAAGYAKAGDPLFQHFLARRTAIESQAREDEPVDVCAHEGDYDPDCAACQADGTAEDRRLAAES